MTSKCAVTGNVPGVAASKSETAVFAGDDGSFGAAENNLLFDKICACTSRPTTLLYLPLLNSNETETLIWIWFFFIKILYIYK